MTKTFLTAVTLTWMAAGALAATGQTYECQFKDGHRNNAIPAWVIVEVAADGKSAAVTDNISLSRDVAPVAAKFVKNTTNRLRARWSLKDVFSSSGQKATLNFSLTHTKKSGRAFLNMDIPGYGNTESGNGLCKLRS